MFNQITFSKIGIIFILIVLSACKSSTQKSMRNHPIELSDSCTTDGIHRYRVYIPSVNSKCDAMPLLLIIDPQADAAMALHHFIPAAEKYKFMLVASATLKNNYPDYAHAINLLLDDVRSKYPVSESICLAGFSGGARMALSYAQYMPVNGIIACGALAPSDQLEIIKSPVVALIGLADFNFIEAAQYIFKPEDSPRNLRLEITEDMHGWPAANILSSALGYLHVAQKGGNPCCKEKIVFRNFAAGQKARIDSLRIAGDFISAGLIARNLASQEDFAKYDDFISIRNSIEYSTDFNSALEKLKASIRFELKIRNGYYTALQSNDALWWGKEVASLNQKLDADEDRFNELAYKRIKGFLGIMCYSLCSNALGSNDLENAKRLLSVYRLVEPKNPDMLYDYAIYYKKKNETDSVPKYLIYAIKAGFSDRQKMANDFPQELSQGIIKQFK